MLAEYISNNSFRVLGDESSNFVINRRVKLDCGVDGFVIASIDSSSYDSTYTNIVINEDIITTNLESALYSVVKPGAFGNIPKHTHTSSEGDGGELIIPMTFLGLLDTPDIYSSGQYLRTTISGIEAVDGIILKASNESEWLIKVTNSGTLYTEAI